ncbi:hypothetical protein KYC5002_43340 [Archangium violaceum]|uniref:hypothetical protein n=1 Tax=Archangium violaceum TaxID=83451 RepID=UPI002B298737|nr:hypothetical protein KYC5002_43340 [Archangium gephyra]
MVRSPLPLVALMGAMGCTQDASTPGEATADDTSLLQRSKGEDTRGSSGIRALSPEERESLFPRPLPVPEGGEARDASVEPADYAEQRRQSYEQRMQQLQEDAALRDAGIERTLEERAADEALVMGPAPQDIAGQRRQQLAKERLETGRFGKGSGMKRKDIIHIIRGPDGGTGTDGGTQAAARKE